MSRYLSLLITSALFACCGCQKEDAPAAQQPRAGNGATVVDVVTAKRQMLKRTTTQPATVAAYHQAEVFAKASGYLTKLEKDIGQAVNEGVTLAVISVPEMDKQKARQDAEIARLEAEAASAKAEVDVAVASQTAADAEWKQASADAEKTDATVAANKSEFDRVTDLVNAGSVSNRLRDEARERYESSTAAKRAATAAVTSAAARKDVAMAKVAAAKALHASALAETEVAKKQLEELEALMDYATLKAPFKGLVTARSVDLGDLVRNSQAAGGPAPPLFVVSQLDKVRVRVELPENDAPWVNENDPAVINLRALPGRSITSSVTRTARRLDDSTRTMLAEIDLDNKDHSLLPGMYGEVTITLEERETLVLPAGAVRYDEQGKSYVFLIENGTVSRKDVVTGFDDGSLIEITQGLEGGEEVVAAKLGSLKPGQKVEVRK